MFQNDPIFKDKNCKGGIKVDENCFRVVVDEYNVKFGFLIRYFDERNF